MLKRILWFLWLLVAIPSALGIFSASEKCTGKWMEKFFPSQLIYSEFPEHRRRSLDIKPRTRAVQSNGIEEPVSRGRSKYAKEEAEEWSGRRPQHWSWPEEERAQWEARIVNREQASRARGRQPKAVKPTTPPETSASNQPDETSPAPSSTILPSLEWGLKNHTNNLLNANDGEPWQDRKRKNTKASSNQKHSNQQKVSELNQAHKYRPSDSIPSQESSHPQEADPLESLIPQESVRIRGSNQLRDSDRSQETIRAQESVPPQETTRIHESNRHKDSSRPQGPGDLHESSHGYDNWRDRETAFMPQSVVMEPMMPSSKPVPDIYRLEQSENHWDSLRPQTSWNSQSMEKYRHYPLTLLAPSTNRMRWAASESSGEGRPRPGPSSLRVHVLRLEQGPLGPGPALVLPQPWPPTALTTFRLVQVPLPKAKPFPFLTPPSSDLFKALTLPFMSFINQ